MNKKIDEQLETAIAISVSWHCGQRDKIGLPFVLHPLKVMSMCETQDQMIVAVLHDILEDTKISINELRDLGISESNIESIIAITRNKDEFYMEYIHRCKNNEVARYVKIKDLEHNISRLHQLSNEEQISLEIRYRMALSTLIVEQLKVMKKQRHTLIRYPHPSMAMDMKRDEFQ